MKWQVQIKKKHVSYYFRYTTRSDEAKANEQSVWVPKSTQPSIFDTFPKEKSNSSSDHYIDHQYYGYREYGDNAFPGHFPEPKSEYPGIERIQTKPTRPTTPSVRHVRPGQKKRNKSKPRRKKQRPVKGLHGSEQLNTIDRQFGLDDTNGNGNVSFSEFIYFIYQNCLVSWLLAKFEHDMTYSSYTFYFTKRVEISCYEAFRYI